MSRDATLVTRLDFLRGLAGLQAELRTEIRERTQSTPMMYDIRVDKDRAVTQEDWDVTNDQIVKLGRYRKAISDLDGLLSGVLDGSVPMEVFVEVTNQLRQAAHAALHN